MRINSACKGLGSGENLAHLGSSTAGTMWRDGLKVQIVNNKNVCKMLGTAHSKRSAMVALIMTMVL